MRAAILASAMCLGIVGISAAEDAGASMRRSTSIPAQELGSALQELAKERHFQVIYRNDIVGERRSAGAVGEFSIDEALDHILQGTGLTYRYLDATTVTIVSQSLSQQLPASQPTQGEREGKSHSSDGFRVAQMDQGATSPSAVAGGDAPSSQDGSKRAQIEEIVVTAQKREERLIDTPQSVSVLSANDLNKLAATQFRDFGNTIPGLSYSTAGAGNTQITLRGVTVGYDISPTVGLYVDEVPYGSSTVFNQGAQFGLDAALFDLNRIEVLRGPQGTLYGASAMGGLIKYVTRPPGTTGFDGDAQMGVSSTGDGGGVSYNLAGAVNLPLVADKVGLRVSGYQSHDGGFIDNVALGQKDVNRSNTYGGRLDLLMTPTEALSVRLVGFTQDIVRSGEGTADYTDSGTQPYGNLGQYRKFEEPFRQKFRLGSATVVYDFGPATLTSISAYQTSKLGIFWDISAAYVPYGLCSCSAIGLPNDASTDKFTEEIRLASSPGRGPLEWVLGGFYNHEKSRTFEVFDLRGLAGETLPNDLYTYDVPTTFREYAVFGDLTWHITDRLDVTGGVRDARNHQEFTQFGSGLLGKSAPTSTSSEAVVTYLADARYHLSRHSTVYVRYATGYRPGGPNIVTIAGGPRTFESDSLRSYEAGLKAQTSDGRFEVDVSGYNIDWRNIQIGVISNGFQTYTNAAGGATVQGAELTLTARPARALTVTGAFAYQHAYMNQAEPGLKAAEGERLPNVPRYTASVDADYILSSEGLQPTIGVSVRHVSDRRASFDGSVTYPQYILPSYTAVDVRGGVTFSRFNTQLYIHNALDDRSQLSIIYPQFGPRVAIAQPRTVGVNVWTQF